MRFGAVAFAAALVAAWPRTAAAQATPDQRQRLPAEAEQPTPLQRVLPATPPRETRPIVVRPTPSVEAPLGSDKVRFVLAGIEPVGVTAYTPATLERYYGELVGTEIALSQVYEVASQIEIRYRSDGFVLSRVVVPAQTVTDGRFQIRVIEGFIDEVRIQGAVGPVQNLIERYLANITESRPTNIRTIERYLLLTNDIPGVSARAALRPSPGEAGASQLVVQVTHEPQSGLAVATNRGSRYVGPGGMAIVTALNALSRWGEQTQVALFATPELVEQVFGQASIEARLGDEGLTANAQVYTSETKPGASLNDLALQNLTRGFVIGLEQPLMRSRRVNVRAKIELDYQDTRIKVLNEKFTDERLRAVRTGLALDFRDPLNSVNTLEFTLSQGLDIMGSTKTGNPDLSRIEGVSDFVKVSGSISRLQPLITAGAQSINLFIRAEGQYTHSPMLSREEFRLGNDGIGRGYDPAELSGDRGIGVTTELQINDIVGTEFFDRFQFYGFWDLGRVWNLDLNVDQQTSLSSVGGGVRTEFAERFTAEVEAAQPLVGQLDADSDGRRPAQLYVRLTARF